MFILSKKTQAAQGAIKKYREKLIELHSHFSEIFEFNLNSMNTLYWFSAKPQDQLHVFDNAIVIGKLDFDEKQTYKPIFHKGETLKSFENLDFDTLLNNIIIYFDDNFLDIIPSETTSVYYSEDSISDFQLLIAKTDKTLPSQVNVQILSSVGYFPGNMTLFDNVKKIPYLFKLKNNQLEKIDDFKPKKNDDKKLINTLVKTVPVTSNQSLAMSGGLDSRFVLGILMKSGVKPKLYSLEGNEKQIIKEVAKTYKLDLKINNREHIEHSLYTLMTDSRIYFRGGNYSKMISDYQSDGIIHYGFSLLPFNENSFASAWKKPSLKSKLYDDLINYALLPRVPTSGFEQFKKTKTRKQLFKVIKEEMKFGIESYNFKFKTKKEIATWFYHLSRGLTWTYAHLSDLSFFKYPVFILGDKKSSEYGFRSSAYSNFNKERLRKLNQNLFKDSAINYSDNRKFKSLPPILNDIYKIYVEYFKKLFSRFKGLRQVNSIGDENWFNNIHYKEAKNFKNYFKNSYKQVIESTETNFRVKRTAVTINDTLLFLEEN
ncbi:hypothetical protein [Psychroflexus sp. ALD_RP9]|uniref:hypothetical protein n=1 Tax=Psychroflexus sp. ALD_RP9 TaxID=2777186 RepID=UPI001A8D170E|nr:hypothetical protein [Psychroflexus sp. ALD_RP9]QSS96409.1 hypothetical protein IMZ30_08070 [Psychroflexus sp. ALD_RP9]